MAKIPFKISARTAKLIGRENFSNPEGAIIELVKNSYDADAKNCLVIFDIPVDRIPEFLSKSEYKIHSKACNAIIKCYAIDEDLYRLRSDVEQQYLDNIQNYFFLNNSIYIIDNGHGMTEEIVRNQWMEIGTGNKEYDFLSDDGRVKTGAKGIGRFALDRLGYLSEMWTNPKGKNKAGSYWKMDWKQFDVSNISLDQVQAEIEHQQINLTQLLKYRFRGENKILSKIEKISFQSGTTIKISGLKDNWHELNQENVYKSLESLIPPKELAIPFGVSLLSLQNKTLFGEVETAFFNDFDYKIDTLFDAKASKVYLTISRNELDLNEIKTKYAYLFKQAKPPYDLKTILAKKFKFTKSPFELLKWEENSSNAASLRNLGDISFSFYYLKNIKQQDNYPYREFNSSERQKVLRRFGGIKIYRDSFRVRPYGDPGNDWLKLGDRATQSPAGAGQRIGDWRVGPNQIAGLVKISRIGNPNLIDKSDRGALIENDVFDILKKLLVGIINEFELDRSIILNPFYLDLKAKEKREREEGIRAEAERLAEKIIEERNKVENTILGNRPNLFTATKERKEKKVYQRIIEEGFQNIEKPYEEEAEIAQVRTLASLGLIVSSFAHELKEVKNNVDDIDDLEKIYFSLVPDNEKITQIFKDGVNIIDSIRIDNKRIAHWVEYSLTAIKKDKRKRSSLKFDLFLNSLKKQWDKVLEDRNIKMEFTNSISKPYLFRAFEMDMNTIFSNLISNSIDAFNNLKSIRARSIDINLKLVRNNIEIIYSDTGTGLPKFFEKDKSAIFLPFTTSKKDKDGNDIGTGLGMYLVKNVVNDNNGTVEILDSTIGFKIKINFPTRNK